MNYNLDIGECKFFFKRQMIDYGVFHRYGRLLLTLVNNKLYYQNLKQQRLPIPLKTNNKNTLSTKNYKPLPRNRLWRFRVKRPSKNFSY